MPYDQTYNVDFKKLGLQNLYEHWRDAKHNAWIKVLLQPLVSLYSLFIVFRNTQRYRLQITPQVCYLEKALNDKYDPELRRIYIDEPPEIEGVPLYLEEENKVQVLFIEEEASDEEFILYLEEESAVFSVDFIVFVPIDLVIDLSEFKAVLNSYKLVTKTYQVQFI